MNLLHAVIFGIVEGITEFLPVSSTGHLILTAQLLHIPQDGFIKSFEIAIQSGAILAVIALYGKSLLINVKIMKRVLAAFIPTALVGLLLYPLIKKVFLNNEQIVLWSLFLGGIFLIVFEHFHLTKEERRKTLTRLPYSKAILIGLFQAASIVPGVSRSAATIIGGLALGLSRETIVEFSFLLAIPTLLAATGLDLLKSGASFSYDQLVFLFVGFASSFVVAVFSIKFLLFFIKKHKFTSFGIYRIAIALLFWIFI